MFDISNQAEKEKIYQQAQVIIDKFNQKNKCNIRIDRTRFALYKGNVARVYIKPITLADNETLAKKLKSQEWFMERTVPGKANRFAHQETDYHMIGVIQIGTEPGALLRINGIDDATRGIEFNDEMLKALIEGRKTTCRRVAWYAKEPYNVGEVLYVKEAWTEDEEGNLITKADCKGKSKYKWKQNRKMPKQAAVRYIRVLKIWKENLREITEEGAALEGYIADKIPQGIEEDAEVLMDKYKTARMKFKENWNKGIVKEKVVKCGWYGNPEVWVIEFEEVEVN